MVLLTLPDRKMMAHQHRSPGKHVLLNGQFIGQPPCQSALLIVKSGPPAARSERPDASLAERAAAMMDSLSSRERPLSARSPRRQQERPASANLPLSSTANLWGKPPPAAPAAAAASFPAQLPTPPSIFNRDGKLIRSQRSEQDQPLPWLQQRPASASASPTAASSLASSVQRNLIDAAPAQAPSRPSSARSAAPQSTSLLHGSFSARPHGAISHHRNRRGLSSAQRRVAAVRQPTVTLSRALPPASSTSAPLKDAEEEEEARRARRQRNRVLWQRLRQHARMVGAAQIQKKARTVQRTAIESGYHLGLQAAAERFDRKHYQMQMHAEHLAASLPPHISGTWRSPVAFRNAVFDVTSHRLIGPQLIASVPECALAQPVKRAEVKAKKKFVKKKERSVDIWAPRAKWADTKSLYDGDEVMLPAFANDWKRALRVGIIKYAAQLHTRHTAFLSPVTLCLSWMPRSRSCTLIHHHRSHHHRSPHHRSHHHHHHSHHSQHSLSH